MDEFQKELDCTILVCICSAFSRVLQNAGPQNAVCPLIGKNVFADIICWRISKRNIFDLEWVPHPMSGVLVRRGEDAGTQTQKGALWRETEVTLPQAREHRGHRKWEEARRDSPLELSRGSSPMGQLDLILPASRTVKANCLLFQVTRFEILGDERPRKGSSKYWAHHKAVEKCCYWQL